ncbi:MAG TPA: serine hydrolase [Candidatus Saccharimonadales bacterium]|nr:serine hydrolase [Candidatus Saccharimonadales bacterium]
MTKTDWEPYGYLSQWLRLIYEQKNDIPGLVVAVARDGKIIFLEAHGYADLEKKQKMTPDHLFRIASHSKTFTATAIMQLQEQEKLRIDDYAVSYLPWLKKHRDKRFLKVTIRQLLSHGAGLVRDGLSKDYWSLHAPFPDKERLMKDVLESGLVLDTNTKMKYSNYGYSLLGLIVEGVSGNSYNKYVTDNIIKPLGLKYTRPEISADIMDRLVTGYSRIDQHKKRLPIKQIDTRAMSPATGFCSTAEDLCKYFNAQMVGSGKLLDDEFKKEMQRSQWRVENIDEREEYGLGFELEYINDRKLIGHPGGFPGHITKSFFDPKDKFVIVVLTNALSSAASRIALSIAKTIDYGLNNDEPTDASLLKYAGRYEGLWYGADIVPMGKKLLSINADSWEPFNEPNELEHLAGNKFRIAKTDSFGSEGETVEFKFDKSGKVDHVLYAGEKLLPEKKYRQEMSKKKIIG